MHNTYNNVSLIWLRYTIPAKTLHTAIAAINNMKFLKSKGLWNKVVIPCITNQI